MSPFISPKTLFLSALAVPAATVLLTAYLHNHPLSASRSRTIISDDNQLSSTAAASPTLRLLNPNNHQALKDYRSIVLSKQEIGHLSDEEILARFTKGFLGGWIITPERTVMGIVSFFGAAILPVGFSGIKNREPIPVFAKLSRDVLPPRHTPVFGGNFMVLDYHMKAKEDPIGSFLELVYGDDRKGFSGMHRVEVLRNQKGEDGVTIGYSSYACNPSVDKPIFSFTNKSLMSKFHCYYALYLFQDGIREVLAG